jgi:hypothetical protein
MSKSYYDSAPGVNAQAQVSHMQNPAASSSAPSPGYYAIIPAPVRYCSELSPAAKLMYSEITALCNVRGYCWAGNDYFASLYGVTHRAVRGWVSSLAAAGFIRVELSEDRQHRRIYLAQYYLTKSLPEPVAVAEPSFAKQDSDVGKNLPTGRKKFADVLLKGKEERKNSPSGKNVSTGLGQSPPSEEQKQVLSRRLSPSAIYAPGGAKFVGPGPVPAGKLEDKEKGVSPAAIDKVKAKIKDASEMVEDVVALTGDVGSRSRFRQLCQIVLKNKRRADWDYAYDATKTRQELQSGAERPGAYFHAILTNRLNSTGIRVPLGTRKEQEEIQRLVRASLSAAAVPQA